MSPLIFNPSNDGYWGDTTSTLDWCETNYEVSWYIAEFWNTVTNLSMIIPPLYGVQQIVRERLEKRFLLSFSLLLLVGVGSSLFHMTLKYSMQLMDEIPMVWSTCAFIHSLYMTKSKPGEKGLTALCLLTLYSTLFTLIYSTWQHPLIHQVMYGILVVVMILQAVSLLYYERDMVSLKLFVFGLVLYGGGFLLWNIENQFCATVQSIRRSSPSFLKPFTQLHGWWHIMAGYATYMNIQFSIFQRLRFLKSSPSYGLDWIGVTVVQKVDKLKM
eukprot:GFUD01008371.1.p1 GENE.GFUD01008371.1~~GFUD01008371.1.p1  ORF type:complete len:272 (+),score=72.00 GFUD01008371.1:154-969(+)